MLVVFPVSLAKDPCHPNQNADTTLQTGTVNVDDIPMDTWYRYNFCATIFLQSEVGSKKKVRGLQWMLGTSVTSFNRPNITVKLYHTTETIMPASPTTNLITQLSGTNVTTVLDRGTWTIGGTNGNFMTPFTFEKTFCYNGVDNLVIQIEDRSNQVGTNYTNMWEGNTNTPTQNKSCWDRSDGGYEELSLVRGNWRNNIKLLY